MLKKLKWMCPSNFFPPNAAPGRSLTPIWASGMPQGHQWCVVPCKLRIRTAPRMNTEHQPWLHTKERKKTVVFKSHILNQGRRCCPAAPSRALGQSCSSHSQRLVGTGQPLTPTQPRTAATELSRSPFTALPARCAQPALSPHGWRLQWQECWHIYISHALQSSLSKKGKEM